MPRLALVAAITTLSATMAIGGALVGVMWERSRHPAPVLEVAPSPPPAPVASGPVTVPLAKGPMTLEEIDALPRRPARPPTPAEREQIERQIRMLRVMAEQHGSLARSYDNLAALPSGPGLERELLDRLANGLAVPMPAAKPLREQFEDRERERRRRAASPPALDAATKASPPGAPLHEY